MKYCFVILQIFLNTIAQISLKRGMLNFNLEQSLWQTIFSLITNWYIIGGISIFVFSLVLWLYLLSQFELSVIYPLCSLAYVFTALGGWFFLNENLSYYRIAGIVIILFGVCLIAKN